jgi:serine/threonine-protein kinase HipA
MVYAIQRFDRSPEGPRHIEDFAQVFDIYPEQKYRNANYESIGRVPATFRRFGERIGYPRPEELETVAGSFADGMRAAWSSIFDGLPLPAETVGVIDARLRDLPLAKGA